MKRLAVLSLSLTIGIFTACELHAQLVHQWTFNGNAQDQVGSAHGALVNGAALSGGELQLDGINDFLRTAKIRTATGAPETLTAKTLVTWVSLDNVAQRSGSALTLENPSGADVFDAIVYGERQPNQWMNGSNGFSRSVLNNGGAAEASTSQVMLAISYDAANNITIYRDGAVYATAAATSLGTLQTYSTANSSDVLLGLRHIDNIGNTGNAAGNDSYLAGTVNEARIYNGALTLSEVQGIFTAGPTSAANPLANPLHRWSFNDGTASDSIGTANGTPLGGATIAGGQLQLDGVNDYVRTSPIDNTIATKTLAVWVTLDNLTQRSGSALTLENPAGGDVFDGIVFGERTAGQWMSGSNGFSRSNGVSNGGAIEASTGEVMMAIVYEADGSISIYREGNLYASYAATGPIDYIGGAADVLLGLRHEDIAGGTGSVGGNDQFLAGLINEARIYGAPLTADEIQMLFQLGPNALQPAAVPEPASLVMWVSLFGVCLAAFRFRRKAVQPS